MSSLLVAPAIVDAAVQHRHRNSGGVELRDVRPLPRQRRPATACPARHVISAILSLGAAGSTVDSVLLHNCVHPPMDRRRCHCYVDLPRAHHKLASKLLRG